LPQGCYAVNLCEDRYLFTVGFAAVMLRGQTSLLPPNRAPRVIEEVAQSYAPSYRLDDALVEKAFRASAEAPPAIAPGFDTVADPHLACVLFTSGSTGRPQPSAKRWGDLKKGSGLLQARFGIGGPNATSIVATVPPQHMYGLETTVLLQLTGAACVHGARPFFPQDICSALEQVPAPRVLITTPLHLRACVDAGLRWPRLEQIISATAPLTAELAGRAEEQLGAPVREIFGCTEGGSLASRRSVRDTTWQPYDGVRVEVDAEGAWVQGPQLPVPIRLSDRIEREPGGRFKLLGRSEDLINIAGKRGSLGDLNQKLLEVPGVVDGAFYVPDGERGRDPRLCALVVAPTLSRSQVLEALAERLDPVFLPRPLFLVDELPRNETGKLARAALAALVKELGARP